jgi:hypothetical protein
MKSTILTLLISIAAGLHAAPILTLNPSPVNVTGSPGSTVGWSFTMVPDSIHWISTTASFLLNETNSPIGIYTDFIGVTGGPSNQVLAPGSSNWTQVFNDALQTGIGSFAIDPSAMLGSIDSGTIRVLYDAFSGDPNTCGSCYVASGSLDTAFSVTAANAPEGAPWMLIAAGLITLGWRSRFIRNH